MNNIFYDFKDDYEQNKDMAIFLIIGGRGTGKTYSTLKYTYEAKIKHCFMKRTDDDVTLLCSGGSKKGGNINFDLNPYKSINKDIGSNVKAISVYKGLGGFWKCDENGEPILDPIGYVISLHKVAKVKGFDLSDCRMIIFDEFIPLPYERVDRKEGIELLDFYKTVSRASFIKEGFVLPLVLLANATTVSCPIINELELADTIVEMQNNHISKLRLEDRSIFIHILEDKGGFREIEGQNPIYKAMKGTQWADMSLNNEFAYNDFSNVDKKSLKHSRCLIRVRNKQRTYYIYVGGSGYYMTYQKSNTFAFDYDLNLENDQKRFYFEEVIDLQQACIEDRFKFQTYEMYDLIMNYKTFYKVN